MRFDHIKFFNEISSDSPVYIYGFGLAGRWLGAQFGPRLKAYIDTDLKKEGFVFLGVPVISIDDAKSSLPNNSIIIISVIDIQDVLHIVSKLPHELSISLGLYLTPSETQDVFNLKESKAFVEYSLNAVHACHHGFHDNEKLFLRSVDIVITERCTLKCRDCSNLMQYYEKPVNIDINEVLKDFQTLTSNIDHVYEVRLIGGEPFMNKYIYDIIEKLIDSPVISRLVIFSNAMVPFRIERLGSLLHSKVVLSLTNYGGLARHTMNNVDLLDKMGIPYRLHPPENWTDSGVIYDFNRSLEDNESLFDNCCGKNLLTVSKGKLYRCPFAANADRLGAIPFDSSNSVELSSGSDSIRKYTRELRSLPACNFCKGRSFDSPPIVPALQTVLPLPYKRIQIAQSEGL